MLDISQPQLAQISCRNSAAMISYVIEYFGDKMLSELFEGVLAGKSLISTSYQYLGSPLTLEYFNHDNNWYSNEINLKIFDNLSKMGIDAFNTGRFAVISAKATQNIATIAYLQMLGPVRTIIKINEVNSLYNRTKNVEILDFEKNSTTVKLNYSCKHNHQVTRQNIGAYTGVLESMGLSNISCKIECDDFIKLNCTVLKFSWQSSSKLQQLKWLLQKKIAVLFCNTYLQSDDIIERYHKNLVISFENEVAEKEVQRRKSEFYFNQLIEQQEKKEQELNLLVKEKTTQLAQSINDKEKLFENFSHELKTPLTLIIGPIEQLLKQQLPQKISQQLMGINSNAHRLFDLVSTLLSFAEIKVSRDKIVATNIYSCTAYIINSLRPLADTKNVELNLNYQCDKELTLNLQAQTWELILSNLLTNAIKHGEKDSQISIEVNQKQDQLLLTVTDINQPITENVQQEIYARFTTSESGERGHGLGLAIVNELITSHKGKFSLTTDAKGNQFNIYLPLTLRTSTKLALLESIPENQLADAILSAPQSTNQLSDILLVEDNMELADFLISSFQPYFIVHHCVNGRDAMQKLDESLFDLIISDVMMPVMGGFEFCRQVKTSEDFQHIPLILLTAKSDIESQKQGLSLQADDYIGKPFNTDILIKKVINMIKTYQAQARKIKQKLMCTGLDSSAELTISNSKQDAQSLFFKRLQTYLKQDYSNANIKAGDIAKYLHISEKTLNRKLQVITGSSATELLREYRLNQAKRQLERGIKAKEVCFDCGFNSLSYFGRCFKYQFKMSPSEYQKSCSTNFTKTEKIC